MTPTNSASSVPKIDVREPQATPEAATFGLASFEADVDAIITHNEYNYYVAAKRAISVQIVDMQDSSAAASRRALRLLLDDYFFSAPEAHLVSKSGDGQTIELAEILGGLRHRFPSHGRSIVPSAMPDALQRFIEPIVSKLENRPEHEWHAAAVKVLADEWLPTASPWAEAIGPLHSLTGMSAALGLKQEALQALCERNSVFAITSTEGDLIFPVGQIRPDGKLVPGLTWILNQLTDDIIDRYTLAAWLNRPQETLGGTSVWDTLTKANDLPDDVVQLVRDLRASTLQ